MQSQSTAERASAILEATSDFVATKDMQGRLTYMNQAGRRLLGIGEDEDVTPYTIRDVHPDWAVRLIESEGIPAALEHGIWTAETGLLARDGREIDVSQVLLLHRDDNGEPEYLSTIARDITERKEADERLRAQQLALLELSAPVVKIWDRVLLVPLVGSLDSSRSQMLTEQLLSAIEEHEAAVAIIDVSGIAVVDSMVAKHLLSTVAAARLMGAECIVTGIRSRIAQTMVQIGVELQDIITRNTLAEGLKAALRITEAKDDRR
jgi:PAS domain S-box-containing protein